SSVPPAASLSLVFGEGGCDIEHQGGQCSLGRGEWMWIDSGHAHRGVGRAGSDFLTVFVPDPAIEAAGLDLAPIGARVQPAPDDLQVTLQALTVLLLEGDGDQDEADSHAQVALDALLEHVGDHFEPAESSVKTDAALLSAKRMLDEAFQQDISIAAIADAVGLRGPSLSRGFVATWGVTPVHYRKQLKLRAATQLLVAGTSVSEAAAACGFADTAHLSRSFQFQYGIAPSAWQRRLGAKSG
ncbi:MAG: AraC family transcriptional regulator, partial [Myxococcota bacterium]